jgi:hypothetical protein
MCQQNMIFLSIIGEKHSLVEPCGSNIATFASLWSISDHLRIGEEPIPLWWTFSIIICTCPGTLFDLYWISKSLNFEILRNILTLPSCIPTHCSMLAEILKRKKNSYSVTYLRYPLMGCHWYSVTYVRYPLIDCHCDIAWHTLSRINWLSLWYSVTYLRYPLIDCHCDIAWHTLSRTNWLSL